MYEDMTPRQIRRNNRLCGEEAIARNKTHYTGICKIHNETQFHIKVRGTRWYPECIECVKIKDAKLYQNKAQDTQELARKRSNRAVLLDAISKRLTQVIMCCKHHQDTLFSISGKEATCIECRRAKHRRLYHSNKDK